MDGIGRSWSTGGSQLDLKANIMSAMNILNSRGDSGSPCLSPMDVVNDWLSLAPNLMREEALMYMFSTSLQHCGPNPHIIIFRNRRGRLTLSFAFWRSIYAAYSGCPMCLAWSIRVFATNMWSVLLLPLVKAPWKGCEMFLSCINAVRRLLMIPVNSLGGLFSGI